MRLTVVLAPAGEVAAFTELRVSRGSTHGLTDDTATVATTAALGLGTGWKPVGERPR